MRAVSSAPVSTCVRARRFSTPTDTSARTHQPNQKAPANLWSSLPRRDRVRPTAARASRGRHYVSAPQRPSRAAAPQPGEPVLLRRAARRHLPLPRRRWQLAGVPRRRRGVTGARTPPPSFAVQQPVAVCFFRAVAAAAEDAAAVSRAAWPTAFASLAAAAAAAADAGVNGRRRGEEEGQKEEQEWCQVGAIRVPSECSALQQEVSQVGRADDAAGSGGGAGGSGSHRRWAGVREVDPVVARFPATVRGDGWDPDSGEAGSAVLAGGGRGGRRRAQVPGRRGGEAARRGEGGGRGAGVGGGGGEEGGRAAARARRGGGEREGQGEQRVQLRPVRARELAGVRRRRAAAAASCRRTRAGTSATSRLLRVAHKN